MRVYFLLLTALPLSLAAGCVGDHHNGAGGEALPVGSTIFMLQPNTATGVTAGTQAGYGIRTMSDPNTFRLIWTGDGAVGGGYHEFWGTMWTPGHFSNQVLGCSNNFCPLESGDFVSTPRATSGGERIDWDTFANDGLDGFEVTTDTLPIYLDVIIDSMRLPDLMFFPDATQNGQISTVTKIPFGITPPPGA
jgi:hypothetical protein